MTIPQIRKQMLEAAAKCKDDALQADLLRWERELYRQKGAREKAPTKAKRVTPSLASSVKATAKFNPNMSMQEIGTKHKINAGRVSEILNGKRK